MPNEDGDGKKPTGAGPPLEVVEILNKDNPDPLLACLESIGQQPSTDGNGALSLSERERRIRTLVAAGLPDKRIAGILGISYWTVRTHLSHIFRKSGARNRMELVAQAHDIRSSAAHGMARSAGVGPGSAIDWQALAHSLVHGFHYGLVVTDDRENILYVNLAFSRISGFDAAEAIGQTPRMLSSGRHNAEFYRNMWRSIKDIGTWSGEIWNRRKDGTEYLQWLDIRVLDDAGCARYVAILSDITERRLEEDRIRHSAFHDALTGLANRMLLRDRGEHEIARAKRSGRRLGVLFVDLNGFKPVNDAYGHKAGDRVLVEIARRLREVCRAEDTLARFGGDEFVALLPDLASAHDGVVVANKMAEACRRPVTTVDDVKLIIGASIGMSLFPDDGDYIDELIVHADMAMYRAKAGGGGLCHYRGGTSRLSISALREASNRLRAAIERDEMEVVFHPRIDLFSGAMIGAEARLHWSDAGRGDTTENDLHSIAEHAGVVPSLVGWLLHRTCAILRSFRAEGCQNFHVAIDLSSFPLDQAELTAVVSAAMKDGCTHVDGLWLEIDEAAVDSGAGFARDGTGCLNDIGASLVMSGLGRGRLGLGCIGQESSISAIKLDKGLVGNIRVNRHDEAVAHALIRYSECLSMGVVADGVAGCDECAALQGMGCRIGQGLAFGGAMDEESLIMRAGKAYDCPSMTPTSPCARGERHHPSNFSVARGRALDG